MHDALDEWIAAKAIRAEVKTDPFTLCGKDKEKNKNTAHTK